MSQEYVFVLPYPPSINSYYGTSCQGGFPHVHILEKGIEYRKEAIKMIEHKNIKLRANIPLKVTVVITPPDNKTRDIDNIFKCMFDALTHAEFWQDDSYVRELHASYAKPVKYGSILMHVESI